METAFVNLVMNTIMLQITARKFVVMEKHYNINATTATTLMEMDVVRLAKYKTILNVTKPCNHLIAQHYFS